MVGRTGLLTTSLSLDCWIAGRISMWMRVVDRVDNLWRQLVWTMQPPTSSRQPVLAGLPSMEEAKAAATTGRLRTDPHPPPYLNPTQATPPPN